MLTLRGPLGLRRGDLLRNLAIIEDGSVLIRDNVVAGVGTTRRIENLKEARTALEIDATGKIVMPGFIDPSLSVSFDNVHYAQSRRRINNFYDDSLALMRSVLLHGTLAAELKAGADTRDFHSDIAILRKIARIGNNPVRVVPTWRIGHQTVNRRETTSDFLPTLQTLLRRKLIRFIEFTPNSESNLTEDVRLLAEDSRVRIKLLWPGGDSAHLASLLDLYHPHTVRCSTPVTSEECALLSERSSISVFPTGRDIFEGPVNLGARKFIDAGGAIALSSGYDSFSAASFSMQMSVSLAVIRLGLTLEEAIAASTINAAHALGCAATNGSIEVGKSADIVLLNIPDYRELGRQFGINHLDVAFRDGQIALNRTRWNSNPKSSSMSA